MNEAMLERPLGERRNSTDRPRRPASLGTALAAAATSVLLGVVALIDRLNSQSLADHARAVYLPYGEDPGPNVLAGCVGAVAVTGIVLWLLVVHGVRAGRWWAVWLAAASVAITATLAVTLLAVTEYGERIFPPVWGGLALLAPLAGVGTVVSLVRRR